MYEISDTLTSTDEKGINIQHLRNIISSLIHFLLVSIVINFDHLDKVTKS
jgi:hypothetical protein